MNRRELEEYDRVHNRHLEAACGLDVARTRRRKAAAQPPSPERIREVSDAVLRRRMDQAAEELRRRRIKGK